MSSSRLVNYDQSPGSPGEEPCEDSVDLKMEGGSVEPSLQSPLSPMMQDTSLPGETLDLNRNKVDHPDESNPISLEMINPDELPQETKMKIEELRVRTGNDPDAAEFESLVLPGQLKLTSHLRRCRRNVVFAHSLSMSEFTHQNVLEIMEHCTQFKVAFNRQMEMTSEQSFWKGCLTFRMPTVSEAEEAFLLLKDVRSDLNVRILKDSEDAFDVMERWCSQDMNYDNCKETERLLIVNNLAPGSTEAKLRHLFSDALEVVLAQQKISDKSFAYLIFESRSKMEEAYIKYTSRNINYDGHILRILKYEPPKNIPEDFLRMKERFQILKLLQRFVAVLTLDDGLPQQLRTKTRMAASYLSDLLSSDERARNLLGLPIFSLEALYHVLDVSKSSTATDQLPFIKLFADFNAELDRLKESKNERRYYLSSDSSEIDKKVEKSELDFKQTRQIDGDQHDKTPTRHIPRQLPRHQSRTHSIPGHSAPLSANIRRSSYPKEFSYARGHGYLRHEPFATSSHASRRRTSRPWTKYSQH